MIKLSFILLLVYMIAIQVNESNQLMRRRRILLGGRSERDLDDPKIKERALKLAQFAVDEKTKQDQIPYVLTNIKSYSTQLVNGLNHFLDLEFESPDDNFQANVVVYQSFRGKLSLTRFDLLDSSEKN